MTYARTGGAHTHEVPPSQPKKIICHAFEFIFGSCRHKYGKARQRRAQSHWPAPNFGSKGRHSRAPTHRNVQTRQKASPNTAQRERTQIIPQFGAARALNIQHTFTTSTAPERGSSMAVEKNDSIDEARGYGVVTSGGGGKQRKSHMRGFCIILRISCRTRGCALMSSIGPGNV